MSANNYLKIHRDGREYVIVISELCTDTDKGRELNRTKGLKAAIEWAEQYQQENMVAYGIHFGEV